MKSIRCLALFACLVSLLNGCAFLYQPTMVDGKEIAPLKVFQILGAKEALCEKVWDQKFIAADLMKRKGVYDQWQAAMYVDPDRGKEMENRYLDIIRKNIRRLSNFNEEKLYVVTSAGYLDRYSDKLGGFPVGGGFGNKFVVQFDFSRKELEDAQRLIGTDLGFLADEPTYGSSKLNMELSIEYPLEDDGSSSLFVKDDTLVYRVSPEEKERINERWIQTGKRKEFYVESIVLVDQCVEKSHARSKLKTKLHTVKLIEKKYWDVITSRANPHFQNR